jgi:hypothetical protein
MIYRELEPSEVFLSLRKQQILILPLNIKFNF